MATPTLRPLPAAGALALAASLVCGAAAPALAGDAALHLQGLFCNAHAQVETALAHIAQGWSPAAAAERVNRDAVVCTYVDRLRFVVADPVIVGAVPQVYRGALVAVVVGARSRPVSPPVEIFFVTPQRVRSAALERRT
jgi:hypothetical protein